MSRILRTYSRLPIVSFSPCSSHAWAIRCTRTESACCTVAVLYHQRRKLARVATGTAASFPQDASKKCSASSDLSYRQCVSHPRRIRARHAHVSRTARFCGLAGRIRLQKRYRAVIVEGFYYKISGRRIGDLSMLCEGGVEQRAAAGGDIDRTMHRLPRHSRAAKLSDQIGGIFCLLQRCVVWN
jgi:hypothetical protein